jgi:hypothetical protein
MSKSLKLRVEQWSRLKEKLLLDYPRSTVLIREKSQRVLGFVSRSHLGWSDGRYTEVIYLDFYNEPKKTMFALKYSEFIDNDTKKTV